MTLGTVASVVGIAAGVNSIMNSPSGGSSQQQTQQAADPFAPYRPGLGTAYATALTGGNRVDPTQMPGYSQWMSGVLNPALSSVQAQDAASGRGWSGQEATDLTKTASQGYYGFMTDYLNRLAQGSGAVNNPAPAASLGFQQQQANQSGFMQGIGGVIQGAKGVYNNWGGGVNDASPDAGQTGALSGGDPNAYVGATQDAGGGWYAPGYSPG